MNQIKYDVIYILDPNSSVEEMAVVSTKIEQIVADAKGVVLKKDDWGKRRLAYLVQKHRDGHYVFFHLSVDTATIAEITRNLRLLEKVIKFSIVKDTISHLKPLPKPVRNITAMSGPTGRPSAPRSSSHSAPSSRAPGAPPASSTPAPAPTAVPEAAPAPVAAAEPAPAPVDAPPSPSTPAV